MQCRLSLTCSTKLSAPLLKVPTMEGECHPRQTLRVQIIHASRCRKYIACIVADQTYSSSFYRVPLISSPCPPWNMILCFFVMSFWAFACTNIMQSMSTYEYLVSVRVWTTSGLEKESRNWGKAKQLECIQERVMRTNQRLKGWWQIIKQRFQVYFCSFIYMSYRNPSFHDQVFVW